MMYLCAAQVKNPHSDHQELDVMRILAGRDMRGGRADTASVCDAVRLRGEHAAHYSRTA